MRRFALASLAIFTIFAARPATAAIATNAEHAILMDGDSGQVLWAKDAYVPMPPASMSKLMTIELLFQRLKDGRVKHRLGARRLEGPGHGNGIQQVERGFGNARGQARGVAATGDGEAIRVEEGCEAPSEQAARPGHEQAQASLRANITPMSLIP